MSVSRIVRMAGFLGATLSLFVATGCYGWARANGGPTYSTTGRQGQGGYVGGIDGVFGLKENSKINRSQKPFPVGLHNSVEIALGPDRKTLGWGTALAMWSKPRPISPYVLLGSYLHADLLQNKFSFGNVSPYGEIGLVGQLGDRTDEDENGMIFTLGLELQYLIQYLHPPGEPVLPGFFTLKFGIGYEKN